MRPFDIDLVYLWVDGSDLEWLTKKNRFLGLQTHFSEEAITKARNADNGELMYSLRSMEKHAPWIRKVFIVTDEQTPRWLDLTNDREVVDIRQLLPPESCLVTIRWLLSTAYMEDTGPVRALSRE